MTLRTRRRPSGPSMGPCWRREDEDCLLFMVELEKGYAKAWLLVGGGGGGSVREGRRRDMVLGIDGR